MPRPPARWDRSTAYEIPLARREVGAEIADEQVELAVVVVIDHVDLRADARPRLLIGVEELRIAEPPMPPEELHGRGELRAPGLPDVPEPVDRPGGRAGEDVPAPVAVPVGDDRRAVALRDLDRLAPRLYDGVARGERRRPARPFVDPQVQGAVEPAEEEVEVPVSVPVDHRRPAPERLDRDLLVGLSQHGLARPVRDRLPGLELSATLPAEEIDLAGVVRAADQVIDAVRVEVHELWTGADASVDGHLGLDAPGLEHLARGKLRLAVRPDVAIEAEQPAEIADEQVASAVSVHVMEAGAGVGPVRAGIDDRVGRPEPDGVLKDRVLGLAFRG
jgi:hypothetical protein